MTAGDLAAAGVWTDPLSIASQGFLSGAPPANLPNGSDSIFSDHGYFTSRARPAERPRESVRVFTDGASGFDTIGVRVGVGGFDDVAIGRTDYLVSAQVGMSGSATGRADIFVKRDDFDLELIAIAMCA